MHGTGFFMALGNLLRGGRIVTLPGRTLDPAALWSAVERHRVEELAIVGDAFAVPLLAELDRAAATGHVPPGLLARWERALEEAGAWRFTPCVVHGDLAAENVLVSRDKVGAVLEWGQVRVADPADDFAWLVAEAPEASLESVLESYDHTRQDAPDRDLVRRARLSGELALGRWLLHGVTAGDEAVVADAVAMLTELEAAVDGAPW
jgi:hypothetical protein